MAIETPPSVACGEQSKMEVVYFSNEFPNEDLQDLLRRLHRHSKDRQHHILARFFEGATRVVREELRLIPASLKALIPTFESVLEFGDYPDLRKGPLGGSIDGILLCLVELGAFIGYFEKQAEFDFDPQTTCLSGLGIGLLASAAISLASTLADIATTGAEVVRIAFRLGIHVTEVSENLEPRDTSRQPDSWACVIPDVLPSDVQRELDIVHKNEGTAELSKIFISARSPTSVTISGRPSSLTALFRDHDFFRNNKYIYLPVFSGLCHAAHIYGHENVRSIVHTPQLEQLDSKFVPTIMVLSTGTGNPYSTKSALELLEQVVYEILTKAIEWSNVVNAITYIAGDCRATECEVFMFQMSRPVLELTESLEKLPELSTTTRAITPWISSSSGQSETPRGPMQSKIAIVGMSCRLPGGATDTEGFWNILEQGLDVHREIPADRFDVSTHCDETGKKMNTSHTRYGCFIDHPGLFDGAFFNMSPRECEQTDPMQRLALVTAYEALERSGFVPNRTRSTNLHRVGTFYGQAADDYREVNAGQEVDTYYIPGGCRAFGPGRINYFFKFCGPSFSIDTACSSSLATIQTACTSLWAADCDTAVAGGMNVLTNSDGFAGLSKGHFLTKGPNACKTWDAEADGYCRADGVGSVVLKRLEDAEADNDPILGVILSAGTNHSAEAISITHPHAGAQSMLMRQISNRAGLNPLDVSYVEMHGTGTQAGDLVEIKSVTDVFAPSNRHRNQPLYIGAVKSNIGHSEAAAGVTALLKVLLMFEKNKIPRHIGVKTGVVNPGFPKDLEKRKVYIPFEEQPWPHVLGKKRVAIVNNFSAAGGNSSLAVEEAPIRERTHKDPRTTHVIAVSAKSSVSLKGNVEQLIAYLEANRDVHLSDLSYTTTARRYHHKYRVVLSASDINTAKQVLSAAYATVEQTKPISALSAPSVVFAFTGQGASHKSANVQFFHYSNAFRTHILHLDALALRCGFPSFISAIDGSFPEDHTHSPLVTQLALTCTQIALAKYWSSLGIKPNLVIGHSLGEYAALCVAGVLSASDAIFLVGHRAKLLEQRCQVGSHKMMAVKASLSNIEKSLEGTKLQYEVACINGPIEIVLSGPSTEIEAVGNALKAAGHRCIILDVSFAFHSSQTDPILEDFETTAKQSVVFKAPNLPVISPLLRKVVFGAKSINANYLSRSTRETVDFVSALQTAQKLNLVDEKTVWVELGPHPVCVNFVKSSIPGTITTVPTLRRGEDSWTTMARSLGELHCRGIEIDWNEFHRPFEGAHMVLNLPTYKWNDRNYWLQYNGNWALTKGNTFYLSDSPASLRGSDSGLHTSTVQHIIEETIEGAAGMVVMQSDLLQHDMLAAVHGHQMNGCGVVTSSIHADIAFTLGNYLYRKFYSSATKVSVNMNVANLVVVKGLVAKKKHDTTQFLRVSIKTTDINTNHAELQWHNVQDNGMPEDEPFATADLYYEDAEEWLSSWSPIGHLVQSRVDTLKRMASDGTANQLSHKMAYALFKHNLVDYAEKYRGMQSVTMHELEAFADVTLKSEGTGTWTMPPHFIDSVAHLAGCIMNTSDAIDQKANFCVTPGWRSMRFARPLVAGGKYRSYVKMIPTAEDPSIYLGDLYVMQDDSIMGMVGGMKFRRYPRILLNKFFSAPEDHSATLAKVPKQLQNPEPAHAQGPKKSAPLTSNPVVVAPKTSSSEKMAPHMAEIVLPTVPDIATEQDTSDEDDNTISKAMALIAREAGILVSDLQDDAMFSDLGLDSLLSLVVAEKFREELGITASGGLFLEYPLVGDLKTWLKEYYS
ncbi:hypothetical protein BKA67DRAFT_656663 [Truncatella angustata]|uniref:Polyketide synthase n=1 Tax=Truncatella angustata TaxID=152316 RepID=A0A9P9A1U9_9PEZI|nr:uncharacterized protein BKA67DRAFT_656663 [Truncatella angustata]KAH6658474.1 hypothetical protein BKA67DRAFT_656663 [Truncatella angustata]